jgi:hypothetical protein
VGDAEFQQWFADVAAVPIDYLGAVGLWCWVEHADAHCTPSSCRICYDSMRVWYALVEWVWLLTFLCVLMTAMRDTRSMEAAIRVSIAQIHPTGHTSQLPVQRQKPPQGPSIHPAAACCSRALLVSISALPGATTAFMPS